MALPDDRQNRTELFLGAIAGDGSTPPEDPHTRLERYLAYFAGSVDSKPDTPHTRLERFLDAIEPGSGGLHFATGTITLDKGTQTFTVPHNLGTRKVMIFFWADSGSVRGYSGQVDFRFISDGIIIDKMDTIIPGYHQINKEGGEVTPWEFPLFIMNIVYGLYSFDLLATTQYSQFKFADDHDENTFSITKTNVNTRYWWYANYYHWVAIDLSEVIE